MQSQPQSTHNRTKLAFSRKNPPDEDVSREQQAAVRFLATIEAAGLKNDQDMLVPSLAAAGLIGIKQQTLALWRCERKHNLPYIKSGRRIHYRLGDLRRFVERQELNLPAFRIEAE